MKIDNVHMLGLYDSVRASKFPMAVDTTECDYCPTDRQDRLAAAERGSGHDQFLTGIIVQFDLTFSNKAWVELQRYHFIDFVSSQSTMHRATRMDVRKQVNEYVDDIIVDRLQELIAQYNANQTPENYLKVVYNIPSGYQLTARLTTNYRQLKTIYAQRKTHRLPEWREFCGWIESLPFAKWITGKEEQQ